MRLHWVVFESPDSVRWIRCLHFTGSQSPVQSRVTISTDTGTIFLSGNTAQQFYHKLHGALQEGERIIRLTPNLSDVRYEPKTDNAEQDIH